MLQPVFFKLKGMDLAYLCFRKHYRRIFYIAIFALLFASCGPSRYLDDGQVLLHKNSIIVHKEGSDKLPKGVKDDLSSLIKQKPNDRFFGIVKLKMALYNSANKGLETGFKWWVKRKFGEPPVIYDTTRSSNSAKLITLFLSNYGYFNSEIAVEEKIRNLKVKVDYIIDPGSRYIINTVKFPDSTTGLYRIINLKSVSSLLKSGEGYSAYILDKERRRIAEDLKNSGYFYFTKNNVVFEIDSSNGNNMLDILVKIRDTEDSDALKRLQINRVYIFPDNSICKLNESFVYDTIKRGNNIRIITSDSNLYKWDVITSAVFLSEGQKSGFQSNYTLTLSRLSDLGIFDFVNIIFKKTPSDSTRMLDCYICLNPGKKQLMSIEVEGNTGNETRVGTALKYTYQNKNLSRGAEVFTFKVNGGIESQVVEEESFFNTIDLSAQMNLTLPKFLVPFKLKNLSPYFNPKTSITTYYDYQQRPDITLTTANITYGYDWKEFTKKRHVVSPIAINYLQAILDSSTEALISSNPLLRKSLEDQLVIGGTYTFYYSDQAIFKQQNFWYIRSNLDISGNVTKAVNFLYNGITGNTGNFKIFGLNYRHYIKADIDLRRNLLVGRNRSLVLRINAGVGSGIGNSVIPYVKQFYVGGSHSMRAWRVRTLGPGSFDKKSDGSNGSTTFNIVDQTGNIKLEQNIEYRFVVYKFFKGALFLDAGNIWTMSEDTARSGSKFSTNTFLSDYAVGAGAGVRLDFSFFILRLDLGIKMRDPSFPSADRWLISDLSNAKWKDNNLRLDDYPLLNLTIAIGYPF